MAETEHRFYLTHITNTLKDLAGTATPLKTSAKRNKPRPLLVVHSGNTTTGRLAFRRISSKLQTFPAALVGTWPVTASIVPRDTCRNPVMGIFGLDARFGDEILADPVPVLRPGVPVIGANFCVAESISSTALTAGRTNIGL